VIFHPVGKRPLLFVPPPSVTPALKAAYRFVNRDRNRITASHKWPTPVSVIVKVKQRRVASQLALAYDVDTFAFFDVGLASA
jgi:hypothetical protein